MRRALNQVLVLFVMFALACGDAMASAAAATLHGNGGVSVNGNPVMPTTTVFGGDVIETAPNAAANLTMNGSSVLVGQSSSVVFNGQSVSFASGGAVLQTSQGMAAQFHSVTITPSQPAAKFKLQQKGHTLNVAALEGNLSIVNGTSSIGLAAGKSVDINLDAPTQDSSGKTATATNVSGGLIAGAGAVVAVAVAGIVAVSQKPVSPAGP
jgi:hypothetical protein